MSHIAESISDILSRRWLEPRAPTGPPVPGSVRRDTPVGALGESRTSPWLNSQVRNDKRAESLLSTAARAALALGAPDLASQTHGFRGALERRKGNPRGIARWFMAAYDVPGIAGLHRADAAYKAAHGLGTYGDRDGAAALINSADELTTDLDGRADISSPVAYRLNPRWLRLPGGLAHLGLGNHQWAAESLRDGLGAMPSDWQDAG